jgi:hypothetical protein
MDLVRLLRRRQEEVPQSYELERDMVKKADLNCQPGAILEEVESENAKLRQSDKN